MLPCPPPTPGPQQLPRSGCPCAQVASKPLTFGLGWDITGGKAIDLDASVIMMTEGLQCVDVVYYSHLKSNDGSIKHTGDNLTGDGDGDDEQIVMQLAQVPPPSTLTLH